MSVESFGGGRTRRGWNLSGPAFERLLGALDPDRERAALAYEQLRERVGGLLQWWGSSRAAELADETLDRVARKLEEGAVIAPGSLGAYVRGVARMVLRESARHAEVPLGDRELNAPDKEENVEAALQCLDRCLDTLGAEDRRTVLRYYEGSRHAETRQKIADGLSISMTALRIRVHRLRERLEECVTGCLERM
jgi:DNA-directed RNA polymerase specialized sigma24 family protein